mmetsp:Transcript_69673/g.188350  ORF Transcript_69673/g.188350 Transcript_69673/m.188350 type:complete len:204 (-) Transcript_69673:1042-1653(-)
MVVPASRRQLVEAVYAARHALDLASGPVLVLLEALHAGVLAALRVPAVLRPGGRAQPLVRLVVWVLLLLRLHLDFGHAVQHRPRRRLWCRRLVLHLLLRPVGLLRRRLLCGLRRGLHRRRGHLEGVHVLEDEVVEHDVVGAGLHVVRLAGALMVVALAVHPQHVWGAPVAHHGRHASLERPVELIHALVLVKVQRELAVVARL